MVTNLELRLRRGNDSTTCMDIIMRTLARSVDKVNEDENSIMKTAVRNTKKGKKKKGWKAQPGALSEGWKDEVLG